ncbi:helix-turn-helix domain-containing protein [Hymenobacter sp. PAMC 26628]|uniref:helix-turn-helix domain-containing protein n=1 Tax=Hymenobacter sp. PAMC 26628 TaxID=1484118 RepID=UPI0009E9BD30|nr:helix-turn-helix domain-containing protein [Hymenobacter sp. PAMC 26628]
MALHLSPSERQALRELQGRCGERTDYIPVTVVLLLDKGRSVASIADDLGVSVATVYRYVGA